MRRFSGALGLRGFERIDGGAGSRADLRWCIPLPRAVAQLARERIEQLPGVHRAKAIAAPPGSSPSSLGPVKEIEGQFAELPTGSAGYLAGGSYASLRRILVIDAAGASIEDARRRAQRVIEDLGLGPLAEEPGPEMLGRHVRAVLLLRSFPELGERLFQDADSWPPEAHDLARLEGHFGLRAEAAASVRLVADRATSFALLRDRVFGAAPQAPALFIAEDDPFRIAGWCHGGIVAPRWGLLGRGESPAGLAGIEDLKGIGAAYVATKVLLARRVGTFVEEETEYVVLLSNVAFDRLERFAIDRDAYGSLGPLSESMSDAELGTAIAAQILADDTELLFPDALPPTLIMGVLCRSAAGEAALLEALQPLPLRVRTQVAERYEIL